VTWFGSQSNVKKLIKNAKVSNAPLLIQRSNVTMIETRRHNWFMWHQNLHYEKLHPLKPHCFTTTTQKTTHIQVLCNYPLNITTTMQLSPLKYYVLINKLSCQKIS
jgi:hypothetical protein